MPSATKVPQPSKSDVNAQIRSLVLRKSIERMLPLTAVGLTAAQAAGTTPVNITPNPAGLLKKFIIEISGTANNTDGANTANLSDIGLGNLIQSIQLIDTQSVTRSQTTGWHLDFLFRAKHRWGAGSALLSSALNESGNFGNVFGVTVAPTGIAHSTSQAFRMVFELPVCYSDTDLTGALWLGVVNAPAQLSITMNQNPFAAAGVDSTLACWKGAAGNISNVTIQVYQQFLDQVPTGKTGVMLPPTDLSMAYELKNGLNTQAFQINQDIPLNYTAFRKFMSTFFIYNDNPAADAGRAAGTDINYFELQTASAVNFWKKFPLQVARESRVLTLMDFPPGCYYFSHRRSPINTLTYGNTQLIMNPSTAAAGAYALIGWEDFAPLSQLGQAPSLAA